MNRWIALAWLVAIIAAVGLREPKLDARPFHNDEAVNATKVIELWKTGKYKYDPDEYHGPTLHYATALFLWLRGDRELNDATLRQPTVAFGIGLILLLGLIASGLGKRETAWAAIFMAVSPAMVFYSRYFIHEMPLIFFTALTISAGWKYSQTRKGTWAALTGAGLGLMFATKETFVLTIAAMTFALCFVTWKKVRWNEWWNGKHFAIALGTTLSLWLLFFSSFFTNFAGLLDSVETYFPWLKRAGGESPHIHPWYFYFQRLGWFHPARSPVWSEALILGLGAIGAWVGWKRSALHRFLIVYSITLAAIYSGISYKTPWCLLNFYLGILLLAGVGAVALIDRFKQKYAGVFISLLLMALTIQLGWQAWRSSILYAADRKNPYVYAQTVPDFLNLVKKAEGLAKVAPDGLNTIVKVIGVNGDYWPLPWYLRNFKTVGWYDKMPDDPFAPIVIVSAKFEAELDIKSDKKWIMVGLNELRPQRFLEMYVELELWKKYVATLPPPAERD